MAQALPSGNLSYGMTSRARAARWQQQARQKKAARMKRTAGRVPSSIIVLKDVPFMK